ncbi:hypothetical protein AC249_AIPGENE28946 [Exaiptasia diaphana]|nr:hypothetical protein AC249_AIPGENE28946 [Exaiptasia diaphana]
MQSMQYFAYNLQQPVAVESIEDDSSQSDECSELERPEDKEVVEEQPKTSETTDSVPSRLLASLERKSSNKEKTGPKINESLATNITKLMRQKPEEDFEKETLDKIYRPENCAGLSQIKVNQVIWDRVPAEARTTDVKMKRVQNALVKGTTNVALVADLILKETGTDKEPQEVLDKIWKATEDALVCLSAANWELAQRRKDALKPQIAKDYSHLCSQKIAFTDMLFGENVTKQIKDITDDNKVTHKLLESRAARGSRKTYGRSQYRSKQGGAYKRYGSGRARTSPYSRSFLGGPNQYRHSYHHKGKAKSTSTETATKK